MRKPLDLSGINPSALLIEAVKHSAGGTALHLGASSGRNSLYLAANGFKVTAVDSNKSAMQVLNFAASNAKLDVTAIVADTSEFKPEVTYDLVLGSAMVHLFDRQSIDDTIRMMQSITKPGGLNVLLISAENDDTGERPRLFESGILPGYYAGWELLGEEEKLAVPFDLDPSHFHRAGLIAKRM